MGALVYYIVFPAGSIAGARSNTVETNPPQGDINVPWTKVNNDGCAFNYVLNSNLNSVSYSPPVSPPPSSSLPVISPGPNAGTNPSVSITGFSRIFAVTLVTGSKPAAGSIFTATWPSGFWNNINPLNPYVIGPGDNNSAIAIPILPIWVSMNSTGFVLQAGSGKLSASTSYTFIFVSANAN